MDHAENELLTKVGPGTAAGETLRKYWLPVGLSSEVNSEAPKLVRWLGEDLLLFRDEFGRVGLTEPTCPHRGASLDYGWIEAGGIRCCYHGWVFDVNGRCLEQPGEPPDSTFKDKITLKAYPVRELGGMIWAYMGSGQPPVLPNYHFLARDDGERQFSGYVRECNYMQQLENALDPVHATILHGRAVHGLPAAPEWMETPDFNVIATDHGLLRRAPQRSRAGHRMASRGRLRAADHGRTSRRVSSRRPTEGDGRCRLAHADRRFHDGDLYFEIFPPWFGEARQRRKAGQAETAAAHARHAQAVRHGDDQRPGQRGAGEPGSDRRSYAGSILAIPTAA